MKRSSKTLNTHFAEDPNYKKTLNKNISGLNINQTNIISQNTSYKTNTQIRESIISNT